MVKKEIVEFDIEKDFEIWPNKYEHDYLIKITLPEFSCLCPRSGYPDYATIYLEYTPDKLLSSYKHLNSYINSFRNKYISHEESANEIYNI